MSSSVVLIVAGLVLWVLVSLAFLALLYAEGKREAEDRRRELQEEREAE